MQTEFLKDHFIVENIRYVLDVIDYTFEKPSKAFDKLELNFIY